MRLPVEIERQFFSGKNPSPKKMAEWVKEAYRMEEEISRLRKEIDDLIDAKEGAEMFMLDGKELKVGDTLFYRDSLARNRGDIRIRKVRVARLGRKYLYICNFFPESRMATQVTCQAGPNKTWIVPAHEYSLHEDRWSRDKALCDAAKELRIAMEDVERGSWRRTYEQIVDLQTALKTMSETLRNAKEIGKP